MEVYIGVKLKCLVLCLIQFTLVYGITFSYVPLSWVSCLNADILFFPLVQLSDRAGSVVVKHWHVLDVLFSSLSTLS